MAVTARAGAVATRTVRKTRTLLFQHAELTDAQGTLVASAASVHRI